MIKCPECENKLNYILGSKKAIGYKCYFCFECFQVYARISKHAWGTSLIPKDMPDLIMHQSEIIDNRRN